MENARDIAEIYLATWNETDPASRTRLLRTHWSPTATYVDPLAKVAGDRAIGTLIEGAQTRFPGFRFTLLGEPNSHGDYLKLSWSFGPAGAEAPIEGSDVIVLEDCRISQVIGFLDKLPAAA